jgi:UDP-glucose 4-epimerase
MRIEGRRVLVTGGAGFIGSHLVDRLARNNDVTVLDDFSVGSIDNLRDVPRSVKVLRGDIRDAATVALAVARAQVVFHLAVACLRASIADPIGSHEVNALGTLNLLMASRASRALERFIYVSSSEVYGTALRPTVDENHPLKPTTPYAASKLAGESYTLSFCRTYGLRAMVVRPFNAYGPREHVEGPSGEVIPRFVARAMTGKPLVVFGDGLQTRDFTWVEDTVRGIILAAECDALLSDVVNIGRGEEVSILRVAHLVQEFLGCQLPIEHREPRPGDVRKHLCDTTRARSVLGFTAQVGIEEGLARYIAWARAFAQRGQATVDDVEVVNWRLEAVGG